MQALTVAAQAADARRRAGLRQLADTTVQAPQSPSLQPSLVPVQCASSRSQSSTVRVGRDAVDLDDGAAVEEADRAARHGRHGWEAGPEGKPSGAELIYRSEHAAYDGFGSMTQRTLHSTRSSFISSGSCTP